MHRLRPVHRAGDGRPDVYDAFDTADRYRMPVMILADGMLGQMMEPVVLPEPKTRQLPDKPWAT